MHNLDLEGFLQIVLHIASTLKYFSYEGVSVNGEGSHQHGSGEYGEDQYVPNNLGLGSINPHIDEGWTTGQASSGHNKHLDGHNHATRWSILG